MPKEGMPQVPKVSENQENNFKETIANKLRRLVMMGVTISTLLLSACSNEGEADKSSEDKDSTVETLFLKSPISDSQFAELQQLDQIVDSLSNALFQELKEEDLVQVSMDKSGFRQEKIYTYKGWHFIGEDKSVEDLIDSDHNYSGFEVTYVNRDKENQIDANYVYSSHSNYEIKANGHKSDTILDRTGEIAYHVKSATGGEEYASYSYFGTGKNNDGEIWKSKAHVLSPQEISENKSKDLHQEMMQSLNYLKEKAEKELSLLEKN